MNTKQKLAYIAIGGLLVATGMIISPLNAQKDKFGEIECTKLTVVDDGGTPRVILTTDFHRDYNDHLIDRKEAEVFIFADEYSANVSVLNSDNKGGSVTLQTHGGGGASVTVYGKNGYGSVEIISHDLGGHVTITNNEGYNVGTFKANPDGGYVSVYNRGGTKGTAVLHGGEDGGYVELIGAADKTQAKLFVDKYGGVLSVHGKGDSRGYAIMGINKKGNGVISTYDKNGYILK